MDDASPPSLETRMLLEGLKKDRAYPFLRAARWILFVSGCVYGAVGLLASLAVMSGGMKRDTVDMVKAIGGPEERYGFLVGLTFLLGVALRTVLVLATAEGIRLLLDVRQALRDLGTSHADLGERRGRGAPPR